MGKSNIYAVRGTMSLEQGMPIRKRSHFNRFHAELRKAHAGDLNGNGKVSRKEARVARAAVNADLDHSHHIERSEVQRFQFELAKGIGACSAHTADIVRNLVNQANDSITHNDFTRYPTDSKSKRIAKYFGGTHYTW